ncbi:MAG: SPOR domain-containing protein [Gammaproteobacteria bacterium]|nr:SPOR domain-containing protein [Gammaproteobacteria bacterium]
MASNLQDYNPSNLEQLNRVEPTYLASYGLTEAPFSLQQDDRFLYLNSELTEQLGLLKHYTQYGNLLLIVTGERGIGKSSLKQQFINTAQEEWQICEIQSHTMMDASMLLKQIAHGFNITEPPLEPSALFEVLSVQLDHMRQASYVPILIIDDAHELPQDALQSLLYLAENHSDQQAALRIILFCEPEIEIMLDDPAIHSLRDRVTHSMEISSLDEAETAEYLRHRLAVAGLDGTSPFTPTLVHKIFKASEGIPVKINEYAHQNLQDDKEPVTLIELGIDDELIHETKSFNLRNIILGGVALAIVITVLLFQDRINSLFEEPPQLAIEATDDPIKNNNKPVPEKIAVVEDTSPVKPAEEKTIEFSLNKDPVEKVTPAVEAVKEKTEKPIALKLTAINPNPISTSKQRQIISISGSGFNTRQKIKVSWTDKVKILSDTQVTFTSDSYINLILNVGMQADTWKVTVIDPELKIESNTISFDVVSTEEKKLSPQTKITKQEKTISKTATAKLEIKIINGLYGQNWIKQQNKNHFTLQLLGTHNKNTLPSYIKKYSLKNEAAAFKTKRNGKDWYTLIYGFYPTKPAAQAAAIQLPKGVAKPWVRSFSSILPSLSKESLIKNTPVIVPATSIPDNQEGWLWSQDPNHYTLQLAAGTDKKAIQAFIKRHNLKGKAVYFHRLRDAKDWYILVYGSYSSYSIAKQAINQLPSAVQKASPWLRRFSAIHAELN